MWSSGCGQGLSPASCCCLCCVQKLRSRQGAWLSSWASPSPPSGHSFPGAPPGSWRLTWPTCPLRTHRAPAGQEETGWKGFRCPNALRGQNSRPGLAGVIFRTKSLWCRGLWLPDGSDHVPHVLLCSSVLGGMLLQCCRAGNTGPALRMPWYGGEARLESRQVQCKVAKTLMGENPGS